MEGNQQKMRDALSDACYEMFNFLKTQSGGYEEMAIALDKAKVALASPARNCDLKECSTIDDMISAHERFCKSWHDDGKTCTECPYNHKSPIMTCREKWLIAPAAERKGECDGR